MKLLQVPRKTKFPRKESAVGSSFSQVLTLSLPKPQETLKETVPTYTYTYTCMYTHTPAVRTQSLDTSNQTFTFSSFKNQSDLHQQEQIAHFRHSAFTDLL